MRDTFRPNGLRDLIVNIEKGIIYGKEILPKSKNSAGIKRALFTDSLEKTIAQYSVGDDKATVTESLLESIPAFEDSFEYEDGGDYENALWLISLGVLCDIPIAEFKKITAILQRDKLNDALLSLIIKSKQPDWSTSNQAPWDAPLYGKIIQVQNAQEIKSYLDKYWYQAHQEAYWYDLHKNTRVNNYFGYWSWESAAIAKIKGIEDSLLKNQNYYPYDAVHW